MLKFAALTSPVAAASRTISRDSSADIASGFSQMT